MSSVNLLGIDYVMQPFARREAAWRRIAADLPRAKLNAMITQVRLEDLAALGPAILKGEVRGRIVVAVSKEAER